MPMENFSLDAMPMGKHNHHSFGIHVISIHCIRRQLAGGRQGRRIEDDDTYHCQMSLIVLDDTA